MSLTTSANQGFFVILPVNEPSLFISGGRLNYKQVLQSFIPARSIFFERNVLIVQTQGIGKDCNSFISERKCESNPARVQLISAYLNKFCFDNENSGFIFFAEIRQKKS